MSTPLTINSVETLQEALPIIRASQEAYGTFTQEQVDAICEKTAMAVSKMRIPLAKMACEETGYGIVVPSIDSLVLEEPEIVKATTWYSTTIHASVEKGNIFACQFHPEKSSTVGLKMLKNFANLQGGQD